MGIEVNDESKFIRQAIRVADEALKVSQIVPTSVLTSWNDKLEYIITAYTSNPNDIEDLLDDLRVLKNEINEVIDYD
jgi:hypothetical protein